MADQEAAGPAPARQALEGIRICDFTGQLAGAGATKWLASFGADVIRIEDPVRQGRWDILRGTDPFVDERRGIDLGGGFNNHNTDKSGITLNLRTDRGKQILTDLIRVSDAVTENFAAGVLDRWGFGYQALRAIKPEIVYVSNCGFGHVGPYGRYKTWGPIVQAISGLTFTSGLPGQPPAGWGYSYMDHTGGYYMAMAIMLALFHQKTTGEGQWVDLACTEAAMTLHGPTLLDWTINGRGLREAGDVNSNRSQWLPMAPHGIYPCMGSDEWIAIACRDDNDWRALASLVSDQWTEQGQFSNVTDRVASQDELDQKLSQWTVAQDKFALQMDLRAAGIPASAVQRPSERIDQDSATTDFGLWPTAHHSSMGDVRVDGQPVHMSKTDWHIERGAPCLSEHTEEVLNRVLGMSSEEVADLRQQGVI